MTTSNYLKNKEQIKNKPGKLKKFDKYNTPKARKHGETTKKCRLCGRTGGHISKYGLNICRHCFRDNATELGFKKYS